MSDPCPLCGGPELAPFLERRGVPVHQNLLVGDRQEARVAPRGDLRLAACRACGFVTNTAFDPALLAYGEAYDNDQSCSGCFDAYVDALVKDLVARGVRGKQVVEIGCGKGYFLRKLCAQGDNWGVGLDPTFVGAEEDLGGRVRFVRQFLTEATAPQDAEVLLCRHVIEHVPDPMALLRLARRTAAGDALVLACFETPELGWILDNVVIQDFFYEHCSYFTAESLAYAFRAAGFEAPVTRHVFGGQYLWLEAVATSRTGPTDRHAPRPPLGLHLDRYLAREREVLAAWGRGLERLRSEGPVAVWGAGAKGVTFLNLLDPDGRLVDCVVDINPRKQGRFLPGTGHPIVGPESLGALRVAHVVLMNPNYAAEVQRTLEELRLGPVIHSGSDL